MRRSAVMAMALTLTVLLSGCTAPVGTDAYVPEEATSNAEDVQRVLVRGFLDHMGVGRSDDVFRVRVGAVSYAQEGIPFDGYVMVTMEPQDDPEARDWIPRFWDADVDEGRFRDDTGLPYWEFTTSGTYLEKGEPLHLDIRVHLPDGRTLTAERDTYA